MVKNNKTTANLKKNGGKIAMKRVMSFITVIAMLVTMLAISVAGAGETCVAAITSIKNGDVFTNKGSIALSVDASGLSDVKNIDFYANGSKIPGTVIGNKGTVIWNNPCAGLYEITTKINYISGAVENGDEAVSIKVKDADFSGNYLFTAEDIATWTQYNHENSTLVSEHGSLTGKSFKVYPKALSDTEFTEIKYDVTGSETVGVSGRIYTIVWSDYDGIEMWVKVKNTVTASPQTGKAVLNKGWNVVNTNAKSAKISTALIEFPYTDANQGLNGDKAVYISGMVSGISGNTPVPTPVIPSGTATVCPGLKTYRIDFDLPIVPTIPADAITVLPAVDGMTVKGGWNYVDINFPDNSLALDTTYTVSIAASKIGGYEGKFVAATSFTFKTKDAECTNAVPVVKMTYPTSNAQILGDSVLAAQIYAGSSAIQKVAFYDDEALIGEGTINAATGECYLKPEAKLTAGEHTISAKLLKEDDSVIVSTDAVTVEVVDVPEYYLRGIEDGDIIIMQDEQTHTVQVIDADLKVEKETSGAERISSENDVASLVAKVEFYIDGVLKDTASSNPFKYDINTADCGYGEHTVKAKIYDMTGAVTEKEADFDIKKGTRVISDSQDFNSDITLTSGVAYKTGKGAPTFEIKDSAFKMTTASADQPIFSLMPGAYADGAESVTALTWKAAEIYHVSFKYKHDIAKTMLRVFLGKTDLGGSGDWVFAENYNNLILKANKEYKIDIYFDLNARKSICYVDGVELYRLDSFETSATNWYLSAKLIGYGGAATAYIDDFTFDAYKITEINSFGTQQVSEYDSLTGDSVSVTTKAINTTDASQSFVNIIAVYNEDNKLVGVAYTDSLSVDAGKTSTETYDVPLVFGSERGSKVRVFTWESLNTLKPVGAWGE